MDSLQKKLTKRLEISIQAGEEAGNFHLTPTPILFSFIFGIQRELTPFELEIGNMQPGDILDTDVAGRNFEEYFGNLFEFLQQITSVQQIPERVFLRLTLHHCLDASPSDIVKEMAKSVGHGCGGGCGCGCG